MSNLLKELKLFVTNKLHTSNEHYAQKTRENQLKQQHVIIVTNVLPQLQKELCCILYHLNHNLAPLYDYNSLNIVSYELDNNQHLIVQISWDKISDFPNDTNLLYIMQQANRKIHNAYEKIHNSPAYHMDFKLLYSHKYKICNIEQLSYNIIFTVVVY